MNEDHFKTLPKGISPLNIAQKNFAFVTLPKRISLLKRCPKEFSLCNIAQKNFPFKTLPKWFPFWNIAQKNVPFETLLSVIPQILPWWYMFAVHNYIYFLYEFFFLFFCNISLYFFIVFIKNVLYLLHG